MQQSRCTRYMATALLGMTVMATTLPALADDAMTRIKNAGVIHVATEPAYEPFEYMEGNQVVGYGPALLEEIFKGSGIRIHRSNITFSAAIPGLLAGKYDVAATSLTINPERAKKVAFTRPIVAFEWAVLVRADDNQILSMDNLKNKNVGAQINSTSATRLEKIDSEFRSSTGQGFAKLTNYTDYPELQVALSGKRIDAFIAPMPMARLWIKKQPQNFKIAFIDKDAGKILLGWALRGDEKDLRDFINSRIADIKKSGRLDELQEKWLNALYDTPDNNYLAPDSL